MNTSMNDVADSAIAQHAATARSKIGGAMKLVMVTALVVIASSVSAQTAKYTAKIGHLEQVTQPRHTGLEKVAALVKERTKGEVEFNLYPSSQLGNARQMVEGVQFGAAEATVMPAAFLGGFNPVVSVLDIPYIYPTDRTVSQKLREGAFGKGEFGGCLVHNTLCNVSGFDQGRIALNHGFRQRQPLLRVGHLRLQQRLVKPEQHVTHANRCAIGKQDFHNPPIRLRRDIN